MVNSCGEDVSLGVGKRLVQSSKFWRYIRQLRKILVSTVCVWVLLKLLLSMHKMRLGAVLVWHNGDRA